MLWSPNQELTKLELGTGMSTLTTAGFGVSVTPGTNSKGTTVSAASALSTEACVLLIGVGSAGASASARGYLMDVMYDPAGGTSWNVLIPNLAFSGTSIVYGGYWYQFPIYIPSGSTIGLRAQVNSGTTAIRAGVMMYGQPSRPDSMEVGTFVKAFNVDTTTSFGTTAVTPGTSGVYGSAVSIGTTADKLWYWQSGFLCNDATMGGSNTYFSIIKVGGSYKIWNDANVVPTATELVTRVPIATAPTYGNSGDTVEAYCGYTGATADSNVYITAYGMGG